MSKKIKKKTYDIKDLIKSVPIEVMIDHVFCHVVVVIKDKDKPYLGPDIKNFETEIMKKIYCVDWGIDETIKTIRKIERLIIDLYETHKKYILNSVRRFFEKVKTSKYGFLKEKEQIEIPQILHDHEKIIHKFEIIHLTALLNFIKKVESGEKIKRSSYPLMVRQIFRFITFKVLNASSLKIPFKHTKALSLIGDFHYPFHVKRTFMQLEYLELRGSRIIQHWLTTEHYIKYKKLKKLALDFGKSDLVGRPITKEFPVMEKVDIIPFKTVETLKIFLRPINILSRTFLSLENLKFPNLKSFYILINDRHITAISKMMFTTIRYLEIHNYYKSNSNYVLQLILQPTDLKFLFVRGFSLDLSTVNIPDNKFEKLLTFSFYSYSGVNFLRFFTKCKVLEKLVYIENFNIISTDFPNINIDSVRYLYTSLLAIKKFVWCKNVIHVGIFVNSIYVSTLTAGITKLINFDDEKKKFPMVETLTLSTDGRNKITKLNIENFSQHSLPNILMMFPNLKYFNIKLYKKTIIDLFRTHISYEIKFVRIKLFRTETIKFGLYPIGIRNVD